MLFFPHVPLRAGFIAFSSSSPTNIALFTKGISMDSNAKRTLKGGKKNAKEIEILEWAKLVCRTM
jgi:hypothetical protein